MELTELKKAAELLKEQAAPAVALPPFDRLGGLPAGALVELAGGRSSGRFALVTAALSAATRQGLSAALVDLGDQLDPQAAEAAGARLERLLWLRPRRLEEAFKSAELALSTGFALVVLDLGLEPSGLHRLPDAAWLRLARAAKAQKSLLIAVTPRPAAGSAAEVRILAEEARPIWLGRGRSPRLLAGFKVRLSVRRRRGASREAGGTLVFSALPLAGR